MLRQATIHSLLAVLHFAGLALACAVLTAPLAQSANFGDGFRWSSTVADGASLQHGDPTTLHWSIVPDGLPLGNGTSNLVQYLDNLYQVQQAGMDLSMRPWFATLAAQFDTIAAKTGLTFHFVADNGSPWTTAPATTGQGDIRLAGYDLPTPGELGKAQLPAFGGDILLDTQNTAFENATTLGTVLQHELGHSLGLLHVAVEGSTVLMNPGVLPIHGPQFDDLYALTRLYGDRYESGGGNDTPATATHLGAPNSGAPVVVGSAANGLGVLTSDVDFATVDGASDVDYYRIDLSSPSKLSVTLTPRGPAYQFTPEGMAQQWIQASSMSNLSLRLLAADGTTPLATVDRSPLGQEEQLLSFGLPAPGTYYLQVAGGEDANQFYRLEATASAATFTQSRNVFRDQFNSTHGAPNFDIDTMGRQALGDLDSPYDYTNTVTVAGDPTVQLEDGRLVLTSVRGEAEAETAIFQPLRNFGPRLDGERWLMSLNLRLDASVASDAAAFSLVLTDHWPPAPPMSQAAELTLRIAADGDYHIAENGGDALGEAARSGTIAGPDYRVQVLVDETFAMPRVSVGVNGRTVLSNEQVVLDDLERYFSLQASSLSGLLDGDWLRVEIDEIDISILTDAVVGDYNLDGRLSLADYTTWRDTLGRRVLPGTEADGNGNGVVDAGDYNVWKSALGNSSSLSNSATAVPEPATIVLACFMSLPGLMRYFFLRDQTLNAKCE